MLTDWSIRTYKIQNTIMFWVRHLSDSYTLIKGVCVFRHIRPVPLESQVPEQEKWMIFLVPEDSEILPLLLCRSAWLVQYCQDRFNYTMVTKDPASCGTFIALSPHQPWVSCSLLPVVFSWGLSWEQPLVPMVLCRQNTAGNDHISRFSQEVTS